MDAPRLPSPPLRRGPARGALAVARAARRMQRRVQRPGRVMAVVPVSIPIGIDDVARQLAFRPAALSVVAAVVLAVALHLGVGGASASIRAAKRRVTSVTSVAVETPTEVLAEDMPAPPPPPPPPTRDLPPTAVAGARPTAPSSGPSRPTSPGLSPTSFGAGTGPGMGGSGFQGGGGQALPSSVPQASPHETPTVTSARAVSRPPPRYPPAARRDGITGVVVVAIQVDARGAILDVRVVESDPPGVFDAAAIESVRTWRFEPATRDGTPLTTWVRQSIRFTLEAS